MRRNFARMRDKFEADELVIMFTGNVWKNRGHRQTPQMKSV